MRRAFTLGVVAVFLACADGAPARQPDAQASRALEDSIAALSAAVDAAANVRDAARLIALMDSSDTFVWVSQGQAEDYTAFASSYRERFSRPRNDTWVRHDSARVTLLAVDIASSVWSGWTGASVDGVADSSSYMVLAVWRRGPSGWRIASAHESFPDMQ